MARYVRRLQRIGSSTMVSLPKEWVEANGLGKNDEVEVEAARGSVTVQPGAGRRPSREIAISYPLPPDENIAADLTGAYLLGYDSIRIRGKGPIPAGEREKIRASMRRLAGMEIVEEDTSEVSVQFMLDAAAVNPQKILRRMGRIVHGMYADTVSGMLAAAKRRSDLRGMADRDDEVDRQYFLIVRLIRGAVADRRMAGAFDLEAVDILDYRVAANLLEGAGDAVVELASAVYASSIAPARLGRLHAAASELDAAGWAAVEAFVENDRQRAVEAIAQHRAFEGSVREIKESLEGGTDVPAGYLDIVFALERAGRTWADIADLVKPVYS